MPEPHALVVQLSATTTELPTPEITSSDVVYVVGGLGFVVAAALPRLIRNHAVSVAMGFTAVGLLVGLLPLPLPEIDVLNGDELTERLAEVAVITAILGVGLAIDRPFSWRRWGTTWRLLGIAMPLTIAAVALLGWGLMGLLPASALLLAAVLAPTDPVLAGDVQLQGPNDGEDDEVRFGLTSEAGLNDGLAFPFVYLAVFVGSTVSVAEWGWRWLAWELVGKIAIGVAVGWAVGWVLARLAFRAPRPEWRFAEAGEAVVALGAVLLAYGVAETLQGYGFLAVFAAALAIRRHERDHEYHQVLHSFIEQVEQILTMVLLLLLGVASARGLLDDLTWAGAATAVLLVLVIRPVSGVLSLVGAQGTRGQHLALGFFGVRGIGSIYYLAYAAGEGAFSEISELWATVAFTILLSVLVHGVTSTPVMNRLDRGTWRARESGRP
ncbi:cation:proton antiporter [Aquipuribacter sp. SD81]|uniref:cation:proton antiporter n=1 Tax=Aquipuribacter sp. SD81 TaxID=3127703 RepID=UPI003016730F